VKLSTKLVGGQTGCHGPPSHTLSTATATGVHKSGQDYDMAPSSLRTNSLY